MSSESERQKLFNKCASEAAVLEGSVCGSESVSTLRGIAGDFQ
jgi:hypothetical protein